MQINMPKLGLTMTEATLTAWLKAEGDFVTQGEVLFEFESDKATLEYEAPVAGIVARCLVTEGTTVACGTPVAILETEAAGGEALQPASQTTASIPPPTTPEKLSASEHPSSCARVHATPVAKRRARELDVDLRALRGRGPNGRVQLADVEAAATAKPPATPLAVRLAADLGLDLVGVQGRGPGGRIRREDVIAAARERLHTGVSPAAANHSLSATAPLPASPYARIEPLQGVRAAIARHMSDSAFTAPHVTLFTETDATALVSAREQLNAELAGETKLGYNALLVALTARALREYPALNACLIDDEICYYAAIHIALAVDTERGLLAPVIRHADRLDLGGLQQQIDELAARALAGKSLPDDLSGGTFTITNLGAQEIDGFTPIINQPQAAVLGVGRIAPRPAVVAGQLAVRQTLVLSLSFDHRIVDGAPAARFLQRLKHLVERPFVLALRNS